MLVYGQNGSPTNKGKAMSDPFSNWAHRGLDQVKRISNKVQSEIATTLSAAEHKVQQQHHQQLQHDRVELSEKGHLPKAKVNKNSLDFGPHEQSQQHGKVESHSPKQKHIDTNSGNDKQNQQRSEKSKVRKEQAPESHHKADSQKADRTNPVNNKPEGNKQESSKQESSKLETQKSDARKTDGTRSVNQTEHQSSKKELKTQHPQSEKVTALKPQLTADEFLKRVRQAGGFDHLEKHQAGPQKTHAPKSQFVELKNVPEHVRKGGQQGVETKSPTAKPDSTVVKTEKRVAAAERVKAESVKPVPVKAEPIASSSKLDFRALGGKMLGSGLGMFGIVGGYYEVKEGVKQMREGKKLEGALNTTAGVADISCGTTSILYTLGKSQLGNFAAKAGGVGSILSGVGEGINGIKHNDDEKKFEGGLKVTLGAGMLAGGSIAAVSSSGLVGWGVGRYAGSHMGWGSETIDTKVTRAADNWTNKEVNDQYNATQQHDQELFQNAQGIYGKDLLTLENSGVSRKDMSNGIIGLRDQIESARANGQDTADMRQELQRMTLLRGQLSR